MCIQGCGLVKFILHSIFRNTLLWMWSYLNSHTLSVKTLKATVHAVWIHCLIRAKTPAVLLPLLLHYHCKHQPREKESLDHYENNFYLFTNFRDRERDSSSIHWFSPQILAIAKIGPGLKPRARNSVHVSHMGGMDPSTWAITGCLPGSTLVGSWSQEPKVGIEPRYSDMGSGHLNY